MTTHIAIDVGARFTDVVAHHFDAQGEGAALVVCKTKTAYPSIGLSPMCALECNGVEMSKVALIVIGSTLPTDASAAEEYAQALQQAVQARNYCVRLYFIKSNAGLTCVADARTDAGTGLASGVVGGMLAARVVAKAIGERNVLAVDVGASTAKCALIREGKLSCKPYPASIDVDMASFAIGTTLPINAQANLTLADAHTLLGRMESDGLDPDRLTSRFTHLGQCQQLDAYQAAGAVLRQENAKIAEELRRHCTRKGCAPRDCALMAFGGAGALHAAGLAHDLGITRVIIPVNAATFSAWGMLFADIRRDYTSVHRNEGAALTATYVVAEFEQLRTQAQQDFRGRGLPQEDWQFECQLHIHSGGQDLPLELSVKQGSLGDAKEALQSVNVQNASILQVVFHLVVYANVTKPKLQIKTSAGRSIADAKLGDRVVHFDHVGSFVAEIYDGIQLEPGMHLSGPAVVQGINSSVLVPPRYVLTVDSYGNFIIEQIEPHPSFVGDAL